MPTVSKKQEKFMQAVANNPKFAKKVGVNQSTGREFTKEKSMKTKKMMGGGKAMGTGAMMGGMADKAGARAMSPAMKRRMEMAMKKAGAGGMKMGGKVKKMKRGGNTSRMNELEELGRVDAEKGYTKKGKRNLAAEKKRVVKEIKNKKAGGKVKGYKAGGATMKAKGKKMMMGGKVKGYKKGGAVGSASKRADGIARQGRTKGRMR